MEDVALRDLLPTSDISDPTLPLAAPDLRLLKSRLESHSLHLKSKVHSYILSHRSDFSRIFSLCNDALSKTDQIQLDLSVLLGLVSNDLSCGVEIKEIVDDIVANVKEASIKKELLALLKLILGICDKLRDVREGIEDGRLMVAVDKVMELKKTLRIDEVDENDPVVYGLLRKDWYDCFDKIQELLVMLIKNAVQYEECFTGVRVKCLLSAGGIDGIEFHTALEAMEAAGILNYGLAHVSDVMIKYAFIPAIKSRSTFLFSDDEVSAMAEVILKILPSCNSKVQHGDGETIYSSVIQVVKFVYRYVCFQNGSWMRCFGRITWPIISEMIICHFFSNAVPEDACKVADLQNIIEQTYEFEKTLRQMNFLSADGNKNQELTNFVENMEIHYALKKKAEILARARNVLLQGNFSVPQACCFEDHSLNGGMRENVVDLLFLSERCVVSGAASQLMEIVHQMLEDTCLSSPKVAVEFYNTVRDVILLYEVIVPVKLDSLFDSINQVAILVHNDCLYLSQELLALTFQYRASFPDSIREDAVFVDMAPRYHVMAEEVLKRHINLVIHDVKEAVDGANGFQNTHQAHHFESAKFSVDQVIFILEKVHNIWEPLLIASTYMRSMCIVLDCVFSSIVKDILLIDDMAAKETLQLQSLISLLIDGLSSSLESLKKVVKNKKNKKEGNELLHDLLPSLSKILKLSELLDMPLKSIAAAWESGQLQRFGFTLSEMVDFIEAIFTDSNLRKECLWKMKKKKKNNT